MSYVISAANIQPYLFIWIQLIKRLSATITSKGQVTVPKNIRGQLNIQAGIQLDFTLNNDGTIGRIIVTHFLLSVSLSSPGKKLSPLNK